MTSISGVKTKHNKTLNLSTRGKTAFKRKVAYTQAGKLRGNGPARDGSGCGCRPTCEGGRAPGAGSEGDRDRRSAEPARVGRTQRTRRPGAALCPEREPFLPTQRKWRRRSGAPGAHAGVRPGAGRARPLAPPRRPPQAPRASGRRQPARPLPLARPEATRLPAAGRGERSGSGRSPNRSMAAAGLADAQPASSGGPHTRRRRAPHRAVASATGWRGPGAVNQPKAGPERHQSARGVARPPQSSARGRGGAVRGRGGEVRTSVGRTSLGRRS